MRNAAATALLTSLVLALVGISLAVSEHAETRARLDQRLALQADGEASARGGLFTRTRLALRLLAADSALRDGLTRSDPDAAAGIDRALGSLERAEPGLAGAASAIGLDGRERARVVRGEPAPATSLASDVGDQPFFRATLGTRPGGVHVSQPYRSADTGQWVVSNSALVRDDRGTPLGIVRFELPLASVRATAAAALGREADLQVAVVDRASGRKILDTSHGVLAGGPGAQPAYRELTSAWADEGTLSAGGLRLAYRTLTGVPGGLGWVVVAGGPQPSLLAAARISPAVLALLAIAVALAAVGGALPPRAPARRDPRRCSRPRAAAPRPSAARAPMRSPVSTTAATCSTAIAAELARCERTGVPPSVLLVDLDHFRHINDVYGHAVGDRVLSEIATRLQGRLRGYDVLGRWGGEEFIVLAPGVPDDETLLRLAEQIRRLIGALPGRARRRRPPPRDGLDRRGARRRRAAVGRRAGRLRGPRAGGRKAPRTGPRAAVRRSDGGGPGRRGARADPHRPGADALVERARGPAARRRGARLRPGGRDRRATGGSTRPSLGAAVSADCYTI